MQAKGFFDSAEVLTGIGLLVAGLCGMADGRHDLLSQALAPFGVGLIASEWASRLVRGARGRTRTGSDG